MIKTIVSLLITIALIFGVSYYENVRVKNTFTNFSEVLETLYDKTESGKVTYEDGTAVEKFWENQKTPYTFGCHTPLYKKSITSYTRRLVIYTCAILKALSRN